MDAIDEGEVILEEIFDGVCLFFLTVNEVVTSSSCDGLVKAPDKDSLGFAWLLAVSLELPDNFADLAGRVSPRWEVKDPAIELRFPEPKDCPPRVFDADLEDSDDVLDLRGGRGSRLDMDTDDSRDDARLVVGDARLSPSSKFK